MSDRADTLYRILINLAEIPTTEPPGECYLFIIKITIKKRPIIKKAEN